MVCLVVGDANADLSASLERFPHEGDDSAITALGFYSGGTGANVAVAHARLGGSARLLTCVGDDPAAEVALRAAKRSGVDLSFVQRTDRITTGLCFAAISPNGERTFFSHRGANTALDLPDIESVFQDVQLVHLSGHALLEGSQRRTALALVDVAYGRGIPISIDLCLPLLRKNPQEVLALAQRLSVVFANEHELILLGAALGLSGQNDDLVNSTLSALVDAGAALVVAKLGASGSRLVNGSSRIDISPFRVDAMDTTGAGDAFVAAFLFGYLRKVTPEISAQFGNAAGAIVASRQGAGDACPIREEVLELLKSQGARKALDEFVHSTQEETNT